MKNLKSKESWIMKYTEALNNDIIESGDVIVWSENGIKIDHVGIAYIKNNTRSIFEAKLYKGIRKIDMDNKTPFFVIKSGVVWNSKLLNICNYLLGSRYSYLQHFLIKWKLNRPLGGFTNSTFVAMLLNSAGYRINFVGLTPTKLVSELLGLGRKSIEVIND